MNRVPELHFPEPTRGEKRLLVKGMAWADYHMFGKAAVRWGGVRVSYLDGTLELMFPSFEHELRKSRIGGLLEMYLERRQIHFYEHGSATLKKELKQAGKEPDESYCLHRQNKIPDLAIEVAITGGGIDTLEIYRRWKIAEVWIWQRDHLKVFLLEDDAYAPKTASRWLPELDLKLLATCVLIEDGLEARRAFLAKSGLV